MNNEKLKSTLESLSNPLVYNQALIDCRNALNLSKATLEGHFISWLWLDPEAVAYVGADLLYSIQLSHIEEHLVMNSLVYDD